MSEIIVGPSSEEIAFSWGDATPRIIQEMVTGLTINMIKLVIQTAFNGTGATLSLGIIGTPELFMATTENIPSVVGTYIVTPGYKFTSTNTVRLFITPGSASSGNGVILIDF